MEELKSCPFCGGEPTVCEDDSYGDCHVGCDCDAEPCVTRLANELDEAIKAWNTRTKDNE
jgi:Lar family restriction alleviation protein